jgi:hypothetical protein
MQTPNKAERRDFWQHTFARSSFLRARQSIEVLLNEGPPLESVLRSALTTSIVVMYARPFKQKTEPPIRLPDNIVPAHYQLIHDEAIDIRDKIIAHRDIGKPTSPWGFINQVWITVNETDLYVDTRSPGLDNIRATKLMQLIGILSSKMDEKINLFVQQYLARPPKGVYIINLDENPERWLEPWPHAYPVIRDSPEQATALTRQPEQSSVA